jgi:hypothetical protein
MCFTNQSRVPGADKPLPRRFVTDSGDLATNDSR